MEILNSIFSWIIKKRLHQIELFIKYPHDVQRELGQKLLGEGIKTTFGQKFGFDSVKNMEDLKQRIPCHTYEDLFPYINRHIQGETSILWPGEIKWFAKSSGTTNDRSKFIPISKESLHDCHYKGGKDMLALYYELRPETKLFTGKTLVVGGSTEINPFSADSYTGDLSAIILKNLPFWVEYRRTPALETALMGNWEEKIVKMASESAREDVSNISGVPSWTLLLLKKVLEVSGKKDISQIWPNLELYMHGGISMRPYRAQYAELFSNSKVDLIETYNASEGFFGIQDRLQADDMLLMLDYGVYYEFVPMEEVSKANPQTLSLEQVEIGKPYELIITTNAGLWRYRIGDTVVFTCKNPYRIQIAGRTKQFINAFGEELMVHNTDTALQEVCQEMCCSVREYMVSPQFLEKGRGYHAWKIEFDKEPNSIQDFSARLDVLLRQKNSDYDAKRQKDMILQSLQLEMLPSGTFYEWMKSRGKVGGQNKVPRLCADGTYFNALNEFIKRHL